MKDQKPGPAKDELPKKILISIDPDMTDADLNVLARKLGNALATQIREWKAGAS